MRRRPLLRRRPHPALPRDQEARRGSPPPPPLRPSPPPLAPHPHAPPTPQAEFADKDTEAGEAEEAKEEAKAPPEPPTTFGGKALAAISYSINRNVHDVKKEETDGVITAIHDNAEKFDPKTEAVFKYIQIFTAICDSFAHGANDVANAMGPFMSSAPPTPPYRPTLPPPRAQPP